MAVKTNALRIIESSEVRFQAYEYNIDDGMIDAMSIARKIGRNPDEVFKTLVTEDPKHEHFVFVVPANCELDLKKAAKSGLDIAKRCIPPDKSVNAIIIFVHSGNHRQAAVSLRTSLSLINF